MRIEVKVPSWGRIWLGEKREWEWCYIRRLDWKNWRFQGWEAPYNDVCQCPLGEWELQSKVGMEKKMKSRGNVREFLIEHIPTLLHMPIFCKPNKHVPAKVLNTREVKCLSRAWGIHISNPQALLHWRWKPI